MNSDPARRARFEAMALPLAEALYRLARSLASQVDEAEDLVQETYLRAYRTFDNFVAGTNGRAWLFTILYSIARNRHRQDRRRPPVDSMTDLEATDATVPAIDWGSAERLLRELDNTRADPAVRKAVAEMPHEWRMILGLVVIEEMSYDEVAKIVECPVGTVASRLSRARRHLTRALIDREGLR